MLLLSLHLLAVDGLAAEFSGTLKDLTLEAPGGLGGAPDGMAFIVPAGSTASATFGDLGDGDAGIRMSVKQAGDALVCSLPVPLGPQAFAKARVRVPEITAGNGSWMGLNFELRARDSTGQLVSPGGGPYVLIANVREAGGWKDVEGRIQVPTGATQGEFCFRFVLSTGTVEVDKLAIISRASEGGGAAPPALPRSAPPPTAPMVVAAAPAATAPAVTSIAVPPAGAAAGDSANRGFTLRLDQRSSSSACTRWIDSKRPVTVWGSADLSTINGDAIDWSGVAVESYARDSNDRQLTMGGVPYAPLFVSTQAGDSQRFSVAWTPPAGTERIRLCARFSDSAGAIAFDWK
ncbi:MAG: hypothetical protein EXR71_14690 [Myxococcales bacterium]|nr:hypothetical protein [Myxococcales bacterium]